MAKNDPRPIMVRWFDAASRKGWIGVDDVKDQVIAPIITYGWLVKETDDEILVSTCLHEEPFDFVDPIAIPKISITKRKWVPRVD